jgi:hypothetical protein
LFIHKAIWTWMALQRPIKRVLREIQREEVEALRM